MLKLTDWEAKRSGRTMTIIASDTATGKAVKLTGIDYIGTQRSSVRVVAIRQRQAIAELVL